MHFSHLVSLYQFMKLSASVFVILSRTLLSRLFCVFYSLSFPLNFSTCWFFCVSVALFWLALHSEFRDRLFRKICCRNFRSSDFRWRELLWNDVEDHVSRCCCFVYRFSFTSFQSFKSRKYFVFYDNLAEWTAIELSRFEILQHHLKSEQKNRWIFHHLRKRTKSRTYLNQEVVFFFELRKNWYRRKKDCVN